MRIQKNVVLTIQIGKFLQEFIIQMYSKYWEV